MDNRKEQEKKILELLLKEYENNKEYYTLIDILKKDAIYNLIIGERSNGKTYSALEYILIDNILFESQGAIIRRWKEDFVNKRGSELFEGLNNNGTVKRLTNGEWDRVIYTASRFYLSRWDETLNKNITSQEPIAYAFSLSDVEHDKGSSYPNVKTIFFDEFLTRKAYLPNEFVDFMNVVSTIVRHRDDVKIFMCGNTVNFYNPYFTEMGLKHASKMKQGDIETYKYGESGLTLAIQYADSPAKKKKSNVYFAFDNPKLQMITGGAWEMAMYPHCPMKFSDDEVFLRFFIVFDNTTLQCELVSKEDTSFIFIHRKTTPLKSKSEDLIYTPEYSPYPNYRRRITTPLTNIEKFILRYFKLEKVFYSTNEVGEVVRNYLNWCKTDKGFQ